MVNGLDQESLPCPVVRWEALDGVLGLPAQQVARLALEHLAERGECREAHRLGAAVLEDRKVGRRDPDPIGQFADGHLAPGQRDDPGVTVIMGGIGVAILGVALLVLVLRMLLAQAVARDVEATQMQAELDEVI